MTTTDIGRLHQRIDELVERISELSRIVAKSLAVCESCRPFVLGGNGQPSVSDRVNEVQQDVNEVRQDLSEKIAGVANDVTILKTAREIGGRMFWTGIGIAGTISGAMVGVLLKWWLGAAA